MQVCTFPSSVIADKCTQRENWWNGCILQWRMNELNYKGPEPTCLSGSSARRLEQLSQSDLIMWSEKKSSNKLLGFGCSFVLFSSSHWGGKKGNKREILIDLVNMDVAGASKNTLEKWLMALIMVSILRTLAFTVAAKCSLLFPHFLSGTTYALFF